MPKFGIIVSEIFNPSWLCNLCVHTAVPEQGSSITLCSYITVTCHPLSTQHGRSKVKPPYHVTLYLPYIVNHSYPPFMIIRTFCFTFVCTNVRLSLCHDVSRARVMLARLEGWRLYWVAVYACLHEWYSIQLSDI